MGYYDSHPHGKTTATAMTVFLCIRMAEEGLHIDHLLNGDVCWGYRNKKKGKIIWNPNTGEGFKDLIFQPDKMEMMLRPWIPAGHKQWDASHPNSDAVGRDWHDWMWGGRGPIQGWMYNRLHQQEGVGLPYLPTLDAWPGPRKAFGPVQYAYQNLVEIHVHPSSKSRIPATLEMIDEMLYDQHYRCLCGREIGYQDTDPELSGFQLDHVIPRSSDPEPRRLDTRVNYCLLCCDCNLYKSNKSLPEFLDWLVQQRSVTNPGRAKNSHLGRTRRGLM